MKKHIEKFRALRGFWFWVGCLTMFLLYTVMLIFTTVNAGHIWDLVRINGQGLIVAVVGSFSLSIAFLLFVIRPPRENPGMGVFWYDNLMVIVFAGIGTFAFSLLDPVMATKLLEAWSK